MLSIDKNRYLVTKPMPLSYLIRHRLGTITILAAILATTQIINFIDAYGSLPTHGDPDIDVETVRLGKGSFSPGGVRILAALEPFQIIDGHIAFNAPPDTRDIKVVVAESSRNSITHAVIINPTKIEDIRDGEALYHVDLDEEISGRNPWTDRSDKVDDYSNVYLMNVGRSSISFNDQSQVTITAIFG